MLSVNELEMSYGSLQVIKNISFSVQPGEIVAIIGPSGSGKSTILRGINFLEPYQGGEIRVKGQLVGWQDTASSPRRQRSEMEISAMRAQVGMVFQSFNLFPHRTVLDNVTAGLRHVRRLPRVQCEEIGQRLLKKVGLSHKAGEYPASLSGGQQQRVAIARALAMGPELMLFDEVTSALDPELVDEVLQVILDLARDGTTMLLVTHEIAFARDVANRIIFMDHGAIVESGPPEVLQNPGTERLQSFLKRYAGRPLPP